MTSLRTLLPVSIGLVSLGASAASPVAGIYSLRSPVNVTAQIPYTTVIQPGDGTNTIEVLMQPGQPPDHGTVNYPSVYTGAGQHFSYVPDAGYAGLDSFYYKVTDQDGEVSFGLISLNIGNVPAVVTDDDVIVGPMETFLDILFNDMGFADPVTFSITQQPAHGTLTIDVPVPLPGPFWQSEVGVFYTPNAGYTGPDQFRYHMSDGIDQGNGTVTVTVSGDTDGDLVLDAFDNCRLMPNADQRDTDGDGYGNWCDADLNNSGRVTTADYTILRNRLNSTDPDADLNGSGRVTVVDYTILRDALNQPPGPSALAP